MVGEAMKNQAQFGKVGNFLWLPFTPIEIPKGSFQNPKHQVPGILFDEARAFIWKQSGEFQLNFDLAKWL